MKAPSMPWYPADYIKDTRILSLEAKGAWSDFLNFAHSSNRRGELTYSVSGWARLWGCDEATANRCIFEIQASEIGTVTICNDNVTLINRRMRREEKVKEQTRLRVQKHRVTQPCNAPETPLYMLPSSSSSSSSSLEDNNSVENTSTASVDAERTSKEEFYLTRKKRKLTGKRLQSFKLFWNAFAYKKGMAEAADAWIDIPTLTESILNSIISAAKKEASSRSEMIAQGKTPKMAQGWVSGRRWEDEDLNTSDPGRSKYGLD